MSHTTSQPDSLGIESLVIYGLWLHITDKELQTVEIAKSVFGEDWFKKELPAFINTSRKAHKVADDSREKLELKSKGQKPVRQAFLEEYALGMTKSFDALLRATHTLASVLCEFTPPNSEEHRQALNIAFDLWQLAHAVNGTGAQAAKDNAVNRSPHSPERSQPRQRRARPFRAPG